MLLVSGGAGRLRLCDTRAMKQRLKPGQRTPLAQRIAAEVQRIVAANGKEVDLATDSVWVAREVDAGRLKLMHTRSNPAEAPGPERATETDIVDVWLIGRGKVFSASWKPFKIVRFDFGDWVHDLLPDAPPPRLDS